MKLLKKKILLLSLPIGVVAVITLGIVLVNISTKINDEQRSDVSQLGYEILGKGGGPVSKEMVGDIQSQISFVFGDNLAIEDIPISYGGIPILPDKYRSEMIEKMIKPVDHAPEYTVTTKNSEWQVYDVSKKDFVEFYQQYSIGQYYKNGVRLFLVNEKDKKFITLAHDIFPDNEKQFLEILATAYEQSPYYKNYPLLEIPVLQQMDNFGFNTQFTFSSLYSSYKSVIKDARAFFENNRWEVDYFSSSTYYN